MRRKLSFLAKLGVELNSEESSEFIEKLVDKSLLNTIKSCKLDHNLGMVHYA